MRYLFALIFVVLNAAAQASEVHWTKRYEGSQVSSSLNLSIEDGDLDAYTTSNTHFVSVSQLGYVRLGVQERVNISPNTSAAEIEASVRITPYSYNGTAWVAQPFVDAVLTLSFNTTNHSAEIDLADYRMPGAYKFDIQVTQLRQKVGSTFTVIPSAPDYIYLEAGIYSERYYNLDISSTPSLQVHLVDYAGDGSIASSVLGTSTLSSTDELYVSWNYIDGAESYDVEWTWVDNYSATGLSATSPPGSISMTETELMQNSTRIRTKDQYHRIPNVFSKGYLIIRIRPVGRWLDASAKEKYGKWSSGTNGKQWVSDWPHKITISQEHEGGKNWQYQSTYAEEGKKKEVAQYFDGSLRSRQTVTRINSKDQSVVGETIYDNEGRGAINILPFPQHEPSIRYYSSVNQNTGNTPYTHKEFDWEDSLSVTCAGAAASPLSPGSGAGKYYSVNAHTADTDWQQYVPESNGYAFSQVEYTPDNTGRVRRQGGVGPDFQIGSGHQTDYYYLQPTQEELNRLFGYKAGYSSHYKKNMVVDPNGQVSVSYLDMQGRVVATAMAGDNNTEFESLESASDPTYHRMIYNDLMNKLNPGATDTPEDNNHLYSTGRFGANNDGLSLNTQLGVISDGQQYNFSYEVESAWHEECEEELIYPYVYDLVLSVKNDCGEEKFSQVYPNIIGEASIGSAVGDFESILRTITLSQGSYTIEKRLQVNESALQSYVAHYLNPDENPCLLDTTIFEVDVPFDCNTTCEECAASLGSLESYLMESTLLEGDAYDEVIATNRYHAIYNACYEPCTPLTSCDVYLSMLKRDVSPGGQYAGTDPSDPVSIFSTSKWRDPAFLTGVKNYLDAYGNIAYVQAYPMPGYPIWGAPSGTLQHQFADNGQEPALVKPWQLKREDFEAYFENSWAEALIEYHPEYKLYLYMTEICSQKEFPVPSTSGNQYFSSEEFDAILRQTLDGYETAQDNVYGINFLGNPSLLTGPLYSLDPFFNQTYAVHSNVHANLVSWKNDLMLEALTVEYKETGMTMFEFAALTVLCGNNPSSCSYTIPSSWIDPAFTGLSVDHKNEIFQLYKSYYLSYKGQINQLLMDMYGFAQSPGIFNGCIGPDGFTAGAIQAFSHSNYFPSMSVFTIVNLWQLGGFPPPIYYWFYNLPLYVPYNQTCMCSEYFNSKQIRITRIGALYNEGAPAETIITEGTATTDYEQWQQTGLCPLTMDMERLLNKLAVNGQLVGTTPSSSVPEMVPDLYEAITGGYPGPLMNIQGAVSGTQLQLTFNYGQSSPVPCLTIPPLTNDLGSLSWSNYGSSWHIFSISQSYPVPSSTNLKVIIQAGSSLSSSQQYAVTIQSCIDLNGCQAYYASDNSDAVDCGKEKEFEQALLALLQNLASTGELSATVNLSSNPLLTQTILADYLGTNATWNGTSSEFTGSIGGVSRNFSFNHIFSGPVLVTNVDLNRPSQLLHISYMSLGASPATHTASVGFTYRVNDVITPIDFSCPCEERQAEDISGQVEDLLNELFQMGDPEGLQPQSLLEMTWLFEGVEQEISGYYNEFEFYSDECIIYSTHWKQVDSKPIPTAPCLVINVCGPGVKREEVIVHVSNLELDLSDMMFTATVTLSNGTVLDATGILSCVTIPPCVECLPQAKEPISCTDAYKLYQNDMVDGVFNGFSSQELQEYLMDDSTFCAGQLAYITDAYLTYLSAFSITDVNHPLYLTITEFGFTQLGYSNSLLIAAITDYKDSPYSDYDNWEIFIPWNQYVSTTYMPTNPGICPQPLPPLDFPDTTVVFPCNQLENNVATVNMHNQLNIYLESKRNEFIRAYIEGAMSSVIERMNTTYQDKEYHYTLYYYDRAGNLIQTVPPKGVSRFEYNYTGTLPAVSEAVASNLQGITGSPNASINTMRTTSPDETVLQDPGNPSYYIAPVHTYNTIYRYNSLNQLVYQRTPDGGESRFAYDKLGRLVMSQNARQLANGRFSYTRYDGLGRVVEAGEMGLIGYTIQGDGRLYQGATESDAVNAPDFPNNLSTDRTEVTRSIYDELTGVQVVRFIGLTPVTIDVSSAFSSLSGQSYSADNTRNRITGVLYFPELDPNAPDDNILFKTGSFYDYDVHGNVQQLLQVNKAIPANVNNQHLKLMCYEYDLVSGNVLKVIYQPGKQDQFMHRYSYDDDNRITIAETSKDGFVWEKDAKYFYYDHGLLARTEIGEKKVQALDYAYTLQGWIKSVNGEEISEQTMMGGEGNPLTLNSQAGRDVFGYSLSYYNGDYQAANTAMLNYTLGGNPNLGPGLYNGNIRSMHTALSDEDEYAIGTHQTNYTYDQLNRIKSMTGYDRTLSLSHVLSGYSGSYSFDANGNLDTLIRYAMHSANGSVKMDHFVYHYTSGTNQLKGLTDLAGVSQFNDADIDNTITSNNYQYDEIGQLIADVDEDITSIEWTVTNKVKQIDYIDGKKIRFDYDPLGQRVAKHVIEGGVTTSTYYVLDAQGNTMSVYHIDNTENNVYLRERNIYGSSRLGQEQLNMQMGFGGYIYGGLLANDAGDKRYELSNHLGNVLQVISDSKLYMQEMTPTITDRVGISVDGNGVITRTVTGASWGPSGGASVEKIYPGGYMEWTLGGSSVEENTPITVGLSYTNTNAHHNMINYAWNIPYSGIARVIELNSVKLSTSPYAVGSVFKISREGGMINYYLDGVLKRTVADTDPEEPMIIDFSIGGYGKKIFDLKLANVGYTADVKSYSDYYPYGMQMPGRHGSEGEYRYGFNGKEKDDEAKGKGNSYDFGARMYDSRLGRWLSIDPLTGKQPSQSPYKSMLNNPLIFEDPDGRTEYQINVIHNEKTGETIIEVTTANKIAYGRFQHVASWYDADYHTEYYYYDYATITTTTIDKNGKKTVKKATEILYENGIKDTDYFGSHHIGDTKTETWFPKKTDYGQYVAFGIDIRGHNDGPIAKDFAKKVIGNISIDDLTAILGRSSISKGYKPGDGSWQDISMKNVGKLIEKLKESVEAGNKAGEAIDKIDTTIKGGVTDTDSCTICGQTGNKETFRKEPWHGNVIERKNIKKSSNEKKTSSNQ